MRTSVMKLGDPLWAHDQVTGDTLLYLISKISVMGTEDECIKHTPLNFFNSLDRIKSKDT